MGASPDVDEKFYTTTYRDVGTAIRNGDVLSGEDHYVRSGAAEGRVPNPAAQAVVDTWMHALNPT
jgi:predicted transcriptional regulator